MRDYKDSKTIGLILLVMLAVLILSFAFICAPVSATNYYVGHGGSNDSTGLSPTTALLTLAVARDSLGPGDTLFIMGGTWNEDTPFRSGYPNGTLIFSTTYSDPQGAYDNPIVVKAYSDSSRPVIQGNNYNRMAVGVYERNNIVFDSLIVNSAYMGITIDRCDSITVKNCGVHDTQRYSNNAGVVFFGDTHCSQWYYGNIVRACTLYENYDNNGSGSVNSFGVGGYCWNGAIIEDNVIHSQLPNGFGIRLKSGCDSCIVQNNIIYDCSEGIAAMEGSKHNHIRYNVIYNLDGHGVFISAKDGYGEVSNNYIYNNTFYNCGKDGVNCGQFTVGDLHEVLNFNSWNNIAVHCNHRCFSVSNEPHTFQVVDYNCYWEYGDSNVVYWKGSAMSLSAHVAANNLDSSSINQDPLFADTTNNDYSLLDGSPCIGTGRGGDYESYMGAFDPCDTAISQIITCTDTSITSLTIVDDFSLSNTTIDTVIFECSVNDFSSIVKSDTIDSPTDPDTSMLSGLDSNTEYKIRCRCWDTSAGVTDTSNVLTITTESIVASSKHFRGFRK